MPAGETSQRTLVPVTGYSQTVAVFLPATFDLVEFDDATVVNRERATRLLVHANGLVTEPAEQVPLGWIGSSGAQVVTATRLYAGPVSHEESGRTDAIYLAGNLAPDGSGTPLLSLQEWAQLQTTSGAEDSRWYRLEAAVDNHPTTAEVIDVALGSFGWLTHHDLVIGFALHGLGVHDLRLRTVRQGSARQYPCNPLTPHS